MVYSLIRSIINTVNAAPRYIFTLALIWFFLSTSCGVTGLLASPNFFNVVMLFFLSVAVVLAIFGFAKWATWRNSGLRQIVPSGAMLLSLEHILSVQTRDRVLLGARETTRRFTRQPVLVVPPSTESQLLPIKCATCQQEVTLRVASLDLRQKKRLQFALYSTSGVIITIVLELGVYFITNGHPDMYPIGYAHFVSVILLFASAIGFVGLLNYTGVGINKAPVGHKLVQPGRDELERFRTQASTQAQP